MRILLFILLSYGITNILVFGSIFEKWRTFWKKISPSFFGKLMSCPMCLSTWIGGILSFIFLKLAVATPFGEYGLKLIPLVIFLDACFTSGCVWLIHTIQDFFERIQGR